MKSLTPWFALVVRSHEDSTAVSGASPCALPLKSSAQGLVEAPPLTDHWYGQLRLMSCPMQRLPEMVCRFLRHSRSDVCV